MNYYNEIDDKAAAWLRELVSQKLIPAGDVDTRSITEIKAYELTRYTQCHFFAGVGGWSRALQLAEYMLWRGEIVAAMMACLTPGEIEQCAVHGASKSEKGTGGPSMNLIPQGQRIAATKES